MKALGNLGCQYLIKKVVWGRQQRQLVSHLLIAKPLTIKISFTYIIINLKMFLGSEKDSQMHFLSNGEMTDEEKWKSIKVRLGGIVVCSALAALILYYIFAVETEVVCYAVSGENEPVSAETPDAVNVSERF